MQPPNSLERIAIDKISIERRLSVTFWTRLGRFRIGKTEVVVMDMSPASMRGMKDNLQKTVIVFEHFHVSEIINDKISHFSWQVHNTTTEQLQRSAQKNTSWLLLTPRGKLATKKINRTPETSSGDKAAQCH